MTMTMTATDSLPTPSSHGLPPCLTRLQPLPMALLRRLLALFLGLAGLVPSPSSAAQTIFTFDATPFRELNLRSEAEARQAWDTLHLLAALQGLANRESPRLYLFYCREWNLDTDRFWWDHYRQPGGWLAQTDTRELPDLDAVLKTFRDDYDGLVIYDGAVPATSNLASTAAGIERLLPVRWDPHPQSLHQRLTRTHALPVRRWLIQEDGQPLFTGPSPKNAAYRWAMDTWLSTERPLAQPLGAHYLDAWWLQHPTRAGADMHTLSNHDWFIARRAFFFDLSPWADEAPVDEPQQPVGSDRASLLAILRRLHDLAGGGIVKLGGFPPWPFKYTTHAGAGKHEPVPTEWEFTRLISQFNAYKEADAAGLGAMANASFHTHFPLAPHYRQPHRPPTTADWQARGLLNRLGQVAPRFFVGHYVGDYDAPSWLYKSVPVFFRDPARGQVPLGWAFNPNLADRAPQALAYAYAHATTNDFFISGNSGAGYLNPRALTVRPDSGLPSALAAWEAYCQPRFRRWDLTITGFVLDGSAGASTDAEYAAYRSFSPRGLGTHFDRHPKLRAGIPTCPERDLPDAPAAAARFIADRARGSLGQPGFLWARSILKSPAWYAEVSRHLREDHPDLPVEVVDPYTFFGLIQHHLGE